MTKLNIKIKVKNLRKQGYTFSEIKNHLRVNIAKSTLSDWCKDIKMLPVYYKKIEKLNNINREKGREIVKINREKERTEFLNRIKKEIIKLLPAIKESYDFKKIILSILYLGEGSKWKGHRGLMLGSSDPDIIKLYIKLLEEVYSIQKNSLRARISYRADQNIEDLTKFWSKITGLPSLYFYKTKPDPRTIGRLTKNKNYKGVCVITCAGTKFQLELEAIAKILCNKF